MFVSHLFYSEEKGFALHQTFSVELLRNFFKFIYIVGVIFSFSGSTILLAYSGRQFSPLTAKWLFVFLCISVGPGLVANVIFKQNWGRARPVHIEEFGGTKKFTLPMIRANECNGGNCSFVSGEASNIYSVFFGLALVSKSLMRRRMLQFALIGGTAAGFVRIAQGKHFLSDVIFAGIFMWITALLLWWLIFVVWPQQPIIIGRLKIISRFGHSNCRK